MELKPLAVKQEQASAILGIKRSKLLELTYAGEIPSYKIGRSRFWPVAELELWAKRKMEEAIAAS